MWKQFIAEHALPCNCGGFSFLRHNKIRHLSVKLLMEVCPNMGIEPGLQPLLTGETIAMRTAYRQDDSQDWTSGHKDSGERGRMRF